VAALHPDHDGGWGESCESYDDPDKKGIGESTPSQTAWALMGLFASDDWDSDSVRQGIEYLLKTQTKEGTWYETACTGTGFPRVFYLRYHMYRQYFPLLALASMRITLRPPSLRAIRTGRTSLST